MSFTTGEYARHAQHTLQEAVENGKKNTAIAYEPKSLEFRNFCRAHYTDRHMDPAFIETVTEEKLYGFLFYQSYREPKNRGKRRVGEEPRAAGYFDYSDFKRILALESQELSNMGNVVGYDVVNQYMCAILKMWEYQRDMGANNITKGNLILIQPV